MLANMTGLSCEHLRDLLGLLGSSECSAQNILIIDCRSFIAHNDSHIIHSINAFYPPFLRRRNSKLPCLSTLISDDSIRDRLCSNAYYHIILYEELDLTNDSMSHLVAKCLQEEAGVKCINYLEGGFAVFKQQYPSLCTNNLASPLYISTIDKSIVVVDSVMVDGSVVVNKTRRNSHYIYTWPFKSKSSITTKPLTPRNVINPLKICDALVLEDCPDPAEILPYLYLGSQCHAASKSTLLKLGITAVLNVSHNCPNYFEDLFSYKRIAIRDSKHDDISVLIKEAIDFIDVIQSKPDGKVLVHCRAGISRSATVCIAYLIKSKHIRMEEAYEFVKSRRDLISPNFNFMTQLLAFEDQVLSNGNIN